MSQSFIDERPAPAQANDANLQTREDCLTQITEKPRVAVVDWVGVRRGRLPRLDDFPTISSPEGRTKLLQEWFGVLEFPATTAELAAKFAAIQLCEDHILPVAA